MVSKFLITIFFVFYNSFVFASDDKPGRFFKDQPDITDDFQIHFNYLITLDGEDREWDINGKLEKLLTLLVFLTAQVKKTM